MVKYTRKQLLKEPVHQLDPAEPQTVADLLDRFKDMSFQARSLGNCLSVWEGMLTDKDRPTIILGIAGSLIAGGLRKVFALALEPAFFSTLGFGPVERLPDALAAKAAGQCASSGAVAMQWTPARRA